ncbi:AAA_25 domain-containing protein/ChlI domain-containing protein [Cephalotus follicularis]|uniref:AAA_25 domain-containing protein/ChlI domain-containing protein n=1 Tax=Cephalotus follicularis TaxID=3775 RepID=A0A1Q3C6M3_CEPFO|nr:AAA_25 domain-containing protein/ChlI domain-containing protein [Cephalotus follicularis]
MHHQIHQMKTLRSLYAHKNLFNIISPKISRQIHSTITLRLSSDAESGSSINPDTNDHRNQTRPRVWSNYDPATVGLTTKTTNNNSQYPQPDSSNVDGGISLESVNSTKGRNTGGTSRKKGGKTKVSWVCGDCGNVEGQWWGKCPSCGEGGTMKQFSEGESGSGGGGKVSGFEFSENAVRPWLPQNAAEVHPMRLTDVNRGINHEKWRIPLPGPFGTEVARVLGGGLVPASLVLVGGDPGVGKSTLLLQIAAIIVEGRNLREPTPVVYVSGEESVEQIGNRADRMNIQTEELFLYSSTNIEDILAKIQVLTPRALIVDSIQTVYLKGVPGSAGGLYQVKECTLALLHFAKKTKIPVLLAGHVTKSGDIAGPRVLEHIVDVVLYMEGDKYSSHRLLRSVKNRFGSSDELGVFEMSQTGLLAVSNPSEIFLSNEHSDSEILAGLAVAVIMDGSRSFLIEIQALCVNRSTVSRHVNGIQASRADMIISVLMKQAGLKLQENVSYGSRTKTPLNTAIFLNVVSGMTLTETAGDLAIAAAICSSFLEFPIPSGYAFIGEIGLGGELRSVPRMDKRVNTLTQLGYKKCIVPKSAVKSLANQGFEMREIIGCRNLKDVINTVFVPS